MRKIQEHVPLSRLTTMRVGGPARYFFVAKNIKEIREALSFAKDKKLPVFILGGGSNIVISDQGFNGLVLKPDIRGLDITEDSNGHLVSLGAGEQWDVCVQKIVSKNIFSIENLSAIPGTVGAAPVQNIGAYGVELKEFIDSVEVIDTHSFEEKKISPDECLFSYRDSVFKHLEGKHLLITNVVLRISKKRKAKLDYKDILEYIKEHPLDSGTLTPQDVRNIIIKIRARKLPDMKTVGTVGSFFKNPIISKEKFNALSHIYRGLPGYVVSNDKVKVPLGWIIEHVCKKKGYKKNNVGVHDKQALVLVNYGEGTAKNIKECANELRDDIKRHTGILVEFEISFIGEF
ncbi:MAG: UDP-N-acetylmuramate dehydrogenase [Parcubacteria group bacterium]|nr:UDP-N-acetylmuramate dehydrogenase [Parcubacteria group bacterium]